MLFGLPFVAAGVAIVLMAGGVLDTPRQSIDMPRLVVCAFGLVFAGPGLWMIVHGIRGIRRRRRTARVAARSPDEPWTADYAWDASGARDDQGRRLVTYTMMLVFLITFAAPMNYIGWASGSVCALLGFAGFLDIIVVVASAAIVKRLVHRARHRVARIAFRRFPFYLGERLEVDFVPGRRISGCENLTITLRFIREEYIRVRSGNGYRDEVAVMQVFAMTQSLGHDPSAPAEAAGIPIAFHLPEGDFVTRLAERPPAYWELAVQGARRGIDFDTVFLVPVYARFGRPRRADAGDSPPAASLISSGAERAAYAPAREPVHSL